MQLFRIKIIAGVLCIISFASVSAQRMQNFMELGRMELSRGQFAKAIEDFNIALQQQPDNYEGYYLRAYAKFQLDDLKGAEEDCTHSLAINPRRGDVFCYRAITRDRLFNYTAALDDYQKALEIDSTNPEIYINRAITYLALQQFQLALDDCNHAVKLHVKDESIFLLRAACETKLNRFKEAISDYNEAIVRKPLDSRAYVERGMAWQLSGNKDSAMHDYNLSLQIDTLNPYGRFEKALLQMEQGNDSAALTGLNKVIALAPYSASAWFNRAILRGKAKDFYGALNDYNHVLTLIPDHILTYYNRGGLYFENNDYANALADYNKVIGLYPEFIDAWRNRAQVKQAMNNMRGAEADTRKADSIQKLMTTASDSSKYFEGLRLLKLMTFTDDFETAKEVKGKLQYNQADIQLQPLFGVLLFPSAGNHIKVYEGKQKALYGSNFTFFSKSDSMEAGHLKKRFDELDSTIYKSPLVANNYFERAIIFIAVHSYDRAWSDFDKAIDLEPHNPLFWFCRANLCLKLIDMVRSNDSARALLTSFSPEMLSEVSFEGAYSDYTRAISLDTTFAYAYYNRANGRINMGDVDGALDDLTYAVNLDSTFGEAYFNRGLLLILSHHTTIACTDLSKAGELGVLEAYAVIKRYCD